MKNKSYHFLDLIFKHDSFKIVFLVILISFLYELVYIDNNLSYFEQFLSFRTDTIDLFFVFLSYSLGIFVVFSELKKDLFTIIRFDSKKKYIFYILKRQVQVFTIIFLLHLFKSLILVNLFSWTDFEFISAPYYNFNIVFYIFINLVKHYIIGFLFVLLITGIIIVFSKIVGVVISVIISSVFLFTSFYEDDILFDKLDYLNYVNLIKVINYKGLIYEFLHFFIYIFMVVCIVIILYKYVFSTRKGILE